MSSIYQSLATSPDESFDENLRPQELKHFIGQEKVVENLRLYIQAARGRGEALDHVLFSGQPGLGKTTLARLIASEMAVGIKECSAPTLERAGDLVGLLTSLDQADVLFIDEIHRLPVSIEEYLYSAMEDGHVDVMLDTGPAARSVRIELKAFTLVGATTREGLLAAPFRARFGVLERLEPYSIERLVEILQRSARIFDLEMGVEAAKLLAMRARGTPRIANRILRRVRDVAQVKGGNKIDLEVAQEGLERLGIDQHGLTLLDRKILHVLGRNQNKPVGLKTLATAIGEVEDTIEDVYEPFLIQQGIISKTARGRTLTPYGQKIMGFETEASASPSKEETPDSSSPQARKLF